MAKDTLLSVQEDTPLVKNTSSNVSVVPAIIMALVMGLGPLSFGYTLGYTSPIGDALKNSKDDHGLGLSDTQNSFFGAALNIGAMVGALSGGVLAETLGRRRGTTVAMVPFIGGFLLIYFAKSYGMAIAGRILTGVAVGITSLTVPVYISEISPPHLRGALGTVFQLAVTIGVLLAYAIGLGLGQNGWRLLSLIGAIIPGVLFVATFFLPSTPRWLLSKGRRTEAAKALRFILGPNADIDSEIAEIEFTLRESSEEQSASIKDLLHGAAGRAMIVATCLMLFQQFSGINSVIFFSGSIFKSAGFTNENVPSLIVSVVQVIVTGISVLLMDKAGRRVLLMTAGIGMCASLIVLGYFFLLLGANEAPDGNIALVSVLLYIACFSLGLGAIPWLMMSEIFPGRVRGLGCSVATLINWTCSFIVTQTFDQMMKSLTKEGVFFFYAGVCALGVMYVLLFAPETKGKTLEQIEAFFRGEKDTSGGGSGTGQDLVKITSLIFLLYIGIVVLFNSSRG